MRSSGPGKRGCRRPPPGPRGFLRRILTFTYKASVRENGGVAEKPRGPEGVSRPHTCIPTKRPVRENGVLQAFPGPRVFPRPHTCIHIQSVRFGKRGCCGLPRGPEGCFRGRILAFPYKCAGSALPRSLSSLSRRETIRRRPGSRRGWTVPQGASSPRRVFAGPLSEDDLVECTFSPRLRARRGAEGREGQEGGRAGMEAPGARVWRRRRPARAPSGRGGGRCGGAGVRRRRPSARSPRINQVSRHLASRARGRR